MAIVLTGHIVARLRGKVWLMRIGRLLGRLRQTGPRLRPNQLSHHLQRDIGWRDGSGWAAHADPGRAGIRDIGASWPPPP